MHYPTLLQGTRGQYTFVIELFEFQNLRNLEIREIGRDTEFCCCDDDMTCVEDIDDSSLDNCDRECDTFVAVLPPDCEEGQACEITTSPVDQITSVSPFGYIFLFNLDGLSNEVGHFSLFDFWVFRQYIFIAINLTAQQFISITF